MINNDDNEKSGTKTTKLDMNCLFAILDKDINTTIRLEHKKTDSQNSLLVSNVLNLLIGSYIKSPHSYNTTFETFDFELTQAYKQ